MLSIVVFHALRPIATGPAAKAIVFGGAGVHAFIFLSGFGLELGAIQRSLSGFYRRRFRRIIVPYFIFVTGLYLANLRWSIYPSRGLRAYLGHVLLFKMFDESIIGSFGYHFWFLSTIIQLYLVFPLLFRALERWGTARFFSACVVVSSLFMAFVIASGRADLRIYNSCGVVFLWEFALGMVAGKRFCRQGARFWEAPLRWVLPLTVIGMALQAAMALRGGDVGELLNNPASLVGYGGFVILSFRGCQAMGWDALRTAIDWVGEISYSLYLVHGLVITRLFWLISPTSLEQQVFVSIAGIAFSLFAAVVFEFLLKLPNTMWSPRILPSPEA